MGFEEKEMEKYTEQKNLEGKNGRRKILKKSTLKKEKRQEDDYFKIT